MHRGETRFLEETKWTDVCGGDSGQREDGFERRRSADFGFADCGGMGMKELTAEEREIYQWQMWIPDLGEEGQRKLRDASVLVTRIGGVGGTAALYLAAA